MGALRSLRSCGMERLTSCRSTIVAVPWMDSCISLITISVSIFSQKTREYHLHPHKKLGTRQQLLIPGKFVYFPRGVQCIVVELRVGGLYGLGEAVRRAWERQGSRNTAGQAAASIDLSSVRNAHTQKITHYVSLSLTLAVKARKCYFGKYLPRALLAGRTYDAMGGVMAV